MSELPVLGNSLGARVLCGDEQAIDDAIAALTQARLPLSFWEGFTGLAWLLDRSGELEPQALDPVDESLLQLVSQEVWPGHYDLITGLVGVGVYALQRQNIRILAGVLQHLLEMSRVDDSGRYWWTAAHLLPEHQREQHPQGHVDLGVAHGMGGAVWLLAAASRIPQLRAQAHGPLEETVAWLRSRGPVSPWAYFPSWTAFDGQDEPARLAWCYGDLGMSVVLGQAAAVLGDPTVREWTDALALGCALRPDELSGVTESFVCHGSAGNALLFDRLMDMRPHPDIERAAAQWRARTAAAEALEDQGLLLGQGGVELFRRGADPTWDLALLARLP